MVKILRNIDKIVRLFLTACRGFLLLGGKGFPYGEEGALNSMPWPPRKSTISLRRGGRAASRYKRPECARQTRDSRDFACNRTPHSLSSVSGL